LHFSEISAESSAIVILDFFFENYGGKNNFYRNFNFPPKKYDISRECAKKDRIKKTELKKGRMGKKAEFSSF
jgi:hypothetical protein